MIQKRLFNEVEEVHVLFIWTKRSKNYAIKQFHFFQKLIYIECKWRYQWFIKFEDACPLSIVLPVFSQWLQNYLIKKFQLHINKKSGIHDNRYSLDCIDKSSKSIWTRVKKKESRSDGVSKIFPKCIKCHAVRKQSVC